jgi:glutamine synthetase
MTPELVLEFINDESFQVVDLKSVDLTGSWRHFPVSARAFGIGAFTEGVGADGVRL